MPKLFIGNIPHASSDTELSEWVESQGFQVESAQIIRDRSTGQSRGFGFVVLNEEWKLRMRSMLSMGSAWAVGSSP